MIYGYARVSSKEQDVLLQRTALEQAGCDVILEEKASGTSMGATDRPVFVDLLARLTSGDVLVAWKIDRVGRDTRDLLNILADLEKRGIAFRSLTERMDTASPDPSQRGYMMLMSVFAEVEHARIRERQAAGISARKAKGLRHGRGFAMEPEQVREAIRLIDSGLSQNRVARKLKINRATLQRSLKMHPAARG
jgi:DNA invertase Pin-like site-specific DNA recombinase